MEPWGNGMHNNYMPTVTLDILLTSVLISSGICLREESFLRRLGRANQIVSTMISGIWHTSPLFWVLRLGSFSSLAEERPHSTLRIVSPWPTNLLLPLTAAMGRPPQRRDVDSRTLDIRERSGQHSWRRETEVY